MLSSPTISAVGADAFPAPVEAALIAAETQSDLRVNYTMTFVWRDSQAIIARYNARSQSWSTLSGDPDRLDNQGLKKWRQYKRLESAPGGLTYADYRPDLDAVTLREQTADALIYRFKSPRVPDQMENMDEIASTRLVINRADNSLREYSVEALVPFKPNAISMLDAFKFVQSFEPVFADTPPLMTRMYWRAKGSRVFTDFDEEFTAIFSDFEKVE